jgi:hypothetical protein
MKRQPTECGKFFACHSSNRGLTFGIYIKLIYIYTHKMRYYSGIKNGIMMFAVKWMEQNIIMINEINQTQKNKHGIFSHESIRRTFREKEEDQGA